MSGQNRHGGCLCGAVRYRTTRPLRPVIGCHCDQCRRTTGHFMAATAVAKDGFELTRYDGLKWYRASDTARRGFCDQCGATLFWMPDHNRHVAIAAGTLDNDSGLSLAAHIFVGAAAPWAHLDADLPAHDGDSAGTVPVPISA